MSAKKSLKHKLLLEIIVPLFLIIILFGVIVSIQVGSNFASLQHENIKGEARAAAYQTSDFFTKYMGIVNQMATNESILQMMRDIKEPGDALTVASYDVAEKSLNNIEGGDENISLAWTVDLDSGDSVRSNFITRGLTIDDYDASTRDWYIEAMQAQAMIITEPYIDTLSQTLVTSVIRPAYDDDGSMLGLVAIDMTLATLDSIMDEYTLGDEGFFIMTTGNGTIMYYPGEELIAESISSLEVSESLVTAVENSQTGRIKFSYEGVGCQGYMNKIGTTNWNIITGMPNHEFFRPLFFLLVSIIALLCISLITLVFILRGIAKGIIKPINQLAASANEIADGHLDVEINVASENEIGQVAQALVRTVVRLKDYISYIDEISQTMDELAQKNLRLSLKQSYEGEFQKIKVSLENFVNELKHVMEQINIASVQVADGSGQVYAGAQALAHGTENQAGSMDSLSASVADMLEGLKHSAEYAYKASQFADEEAVYIRESKQKMEELMKAIEEINNKSDEIGTIVQTIDSIAKQTNMLSLNASIEAARAGEAGKGFAVVANQVSSLAQQSTEASKNISVLIEGTLKAVAESVRLATESGEIQDQVIDKAREANKIMNEITQYTGERVNKSHIVTQEIEDINLVVRSNSATAEESTAASEELNHQAEVLKDMVSGFKMN